MPSSFQPSEGGETFGRLTTGNPLRWTPPLRWSPSRRTRNGVDCYFGYVAHAINGVAIERGENRFGAVFLYKLYELDKLDELEKSNHPLPPPCPRRGKSLQLSFFLLYELDKLDKLDKLDELNELLQYLFEPLVLLPCDHASFKAHAGSY